MTAITPWWWAPRPRTSPEEANKKCAYMCRNWLLDQIIILGKYLSPSSSDECIANIAVFIRLYCFIVRPLLEYAMEANFRKL